MASLLKPWITRYGDAEGRVVPKGTPGAKKVMEQAEKWYAQYKDANGKRRPVPLCTDKQAARALPAKLEADAKTKELSPEPPVSDQERKAREHSQRPIWDHLEDFRRHLESKGRVSDELASLTPASFNLNSTIPTVTVAAAYSKHRREDVQTLRSDLAEIMRSYIAGKPTALARKLVSERSGDATN